MKTIITFLLAWGILYWPCVYLGAKLPLREQDVAAVSSFRMAAVSSDAPSIPFVAQIYRCRDEPKLFCVFESSIPSKKAAYLPKEDSGSDAMRDKIERWEVRVVNARASGNSTFRLLLRSTSTTFGDQVSIYDVLSDGKHVQLISLKTTFGALAVLEKSVVASFALTLVCFIGARLLLGTSKGKG